MEATGLCYFLIKLLLSLRFIYVLPWSRQSVISCFMSFSEHVLYHVFTSQKNHIKHEDGQSIHTFVKKLNRPTDRFLKPFFIYLVWNFIINVFLINGVNKTEAVVFSCRLCFLMAFPFISLNKSYIYTPIYLHLHKTVLKCFSN